MNTNMTRYLLLSALLLPSGAALAAGPITVYAGLYGSRLTLEGRAGSGERHSYALREDMGYDNAFNKTVYVGVEHALPLLPNIRLAHTGYSESATHTTARYTADSELSVNATHVTLYYTMIEAPVKLDLGFDLRRFSVDFMIHANVAGPIPDPTVMESETQFIPSLYGAVYGEIPTTDVYLKGLLYYSQYSGRRLVQARAGIGWSPLPLIRLELGYYRQHHEFNSDGFLIDVTGDGPYLSVGVRF